MCLSIYHPIMPLKRGKYDAERGKFRLHGNISKLHVNFFLGYTNSQSIEVVFVWTLFSPFLTSYGGKGCVTFLYTLLLNSSHYVVSLRATCYELTNNVSNCLHDDAELNTECN